MRTQDVMARLQTKYPGEKEYLQAVQEVLESIEEVYNQHPLWRTYHTEGTRLDSAKW